MGVLSILFTAYAGIFLLTFQQHKNYGLETWMMQRFPLREFIKRDSCLETIQKLFITKKNMEQLKLHWCRKLRMAELILGVFLLLGAVYEIEIGGKETVLNKGDRISRPQYGEGETEAVLDLIIDGVPEKRIEISVQEKKYREDELDNAFLEAEAYIKKAILGENKSFSQIETNLNLINSIPDSGIDIEWIMDGDDLVKQDGSILWDMVLEQTTIEITGVLGYEQTRVEIPIQMTLHPKVKTKEEELLFEWKTALEQKKEESAWEEYLELPGEVSGKKVLYKEADTSSSFIFLILGIAGAVLGAAVMDKRLLEKGREREEQLCLDYPVLVNRFALLLGAGLTITGAWERITREYIQKKRKGMAQIRYAYEEMLVTWQEIRNGMSEVKALEGYGKRIGILEYLKFSTLLSQNLRKGSQGILELLEIEAIEAFEKRKEFAKKQGEEAGTRLLIPMMVMLIMVMGVILVPAFMTF